MFNVLIKIVASFFRSRGLVGIVADMFHQNHEDLSQSKEEKPKTTDPKTIKSVSKIAMENLAHYSLLCVVAFAVVIAAEYTAGYFSKNSYWEDMIFVIIFPITVIVLSIGYTALFVKKTK